MHTVVKYEVRKEDGAMVAAWIWTEEVVSAPVHITLFLGDSQPQILKSFKHPQTEGKYLTIVETLS